MKTLLTAGLLAAGLCASAQHQLREVTVLASRPLRDIGVEQTHFDSAMLKENIALSMADVLTYNTGVFVKNYGRATESTVSFRGTSASHTRVSWNGMDLSSPMLGTTDFSTIPSYFIDGATLLHGSSSLTEGSGGLGGAVKMVTAPQKRPGWHAQYVQGIGSWSTFDEFLTGGWADDHWRLSGRVAYSSSPNDFSYRNHDKKENIYDADHNIIGSYYPKEKNRSGAFKDFHALGEACYDTRAGNRYSLSAWYMSSDRELPLLTTDYTSDTRFENRRREQTIRTVGAWEHSLTQAKLTARVSYAHTWTAYDYRRDPGNGILATMTRSRSSIDGLSGQGIWDWYPMSNLSVTADATVRYNAVNSADRSGEIDLGYDRSRAEVSLMASAKWRPARHMGISLILRDDSYGSRITAPVPALLLDAVIWPKANIMAKGSVSRNHRAPTLNDLYYMPGGNPDLRDETGWTYDVGLSGQWGIDKALTASAGLNWFDSRIDDWIMWLPTVKGFYTPRNILRVHAYGIEAQASLGLRLPKGWTLEAQGNFSWTPSINQGDPISAADRSVGRQLPYIPRRSASATLRLGWHRWSLLYKWCHYSERFTMSSNDVTLSGRLPAYYMSNVTVERTFTLRPVDLSVKLAVNNLFNEEYLSVLARPMPGINFEIFLGVSI